MGTIIIVGVLVIIAVGLWIKANRKVKSAEAIIAVTTDGVGSGGNTEQSDIAI